MQDSGIIVLGAAAAGLLAGIWFGLMTGLLTANDEILDECHKQHNVYECIVIAVPKEKEGVYAD